MPALELVLAGFLLVSTLQAVRFLPYFAIAWCALAARCSPIPGNGSGPRCSCGPCWPSSGLSLLQGPFWPAGTPAASVPVTAVHFLQHRPGRVFSTYLGTTTSTTWIPEFVDGRTELYTSGPVLRQYLAVDNLTTLPTDPAAYDVEYVLWPTGTPCRSILQRTEPMAGGMAVSSGDHLPYRGPDATTAQPVNRAEPLSIRRTSGGGAGPLWMPTTPKKSDQFGELTLLATLFSVLLTELPRKCRATRATTAMRARSSAYSTRLAPN